MVALGERLFTDGRFAQWFAAEGGLTVNRPPMAGDPILAELLVAGSAVFKGGSVANPAPYGDNIRAIRKAAEAAL